MNKLLQILILVSATIIAGCDVPKPMTNAESVAFNQCLEKDWVPEFLAIGVTRQATCVPK